MASSPSSLLLLELMGDGENENTWGQKTNTNLSLLENAIAKRVGVALTSSDVTITDTQYADNQARSLCLVPTGTLSANVSIIVPSRSKMYLIENNTTGAFTVTIKTAAGAGVVCPQNTITIVYCNITDMRSLSVSGAVDADTLDGIDSTSFARLDARNQFTKGRSNTMLALSDGATIDMDASLAEFFRVVLGGNRTFTFSNPTNGSYAELYLVQDGTGSRTITWPANIVWKGGAAPVLSTAANATDKIALRYNSVAAVWYAEASTGLVSTGGGGSTIPDITLGYNQSNVDAFALAGSPSGAVTFTLTISTGVVISSLSATAPAIDFTGFASGSIISLVNNGKIVGRGGRGGQGASYADTSDGQYNAEIGKPGQAGGMAIQGPGSGRTFNITNASGFVFGGGGGGGGGGVSADTGSTGNAAAGGGGGGGAGFGAGGPGNSITAGTAALAVDGLDGTLAAAGTGGAAAQGGTATGGAGGAGGAYGAAGSAGTGPTAQGVDIPAGAAGAAGKAIDLATGAVTFVSGNDSTHVKGAVS